MLLVKRFLELLEWAVSFLLTNTLQSINFPLCADCLLQRKASWLLEKTDRHGPTLLAYRSGPTSEEQRV